MKVNWNKFLVTYVHTTLIVSLSIVNGQFIEYV